MLNNVKGIIVILVCFIMAGIAGWYDNHYDMNGEIVSKEKSIITILDTTGNLWKYETTEEYKIGDKVNVIFDNNTTDNRKDDIITKIKKF